MATYAPFDPIVPGCTPQGAEAVRRGVTRMFQRHDIPLISEVPLRNARRADMMGVGPKGEIIIIEIKCARGDLLGDRKWPDYLEFCDRFYWAVPAGFDHGPLAQAHYAPERCGLIVADAWDAELVREAAHHPLASARRKAETLRLSRLAMRRLCVGGDPELAGL